MFVLVMTWVDRVHDVRTEAFGPWEIEEDGSHQEALATFVDDWKTKTPEAETASAYVHIVTPPETFRERPRR